MDNDYVVIIDGELYHHGIIGMKWGRRRYQNKDGSLTPAGKKRYEAEMEKVKAETTKVKAEQRVKARTAAKLSKLEQAKKELDDLKKGKSTKKETPEEIKARIKKNPNPEDVYKHRELFTDNEIQSLSLRFQNETNIKKSIPEKVDPRKEKINKLIENIGYITDKAVVVTKGYNMVANVLNAFGVTDLPKISTDIDGKGKGKGDKSNSKDKDKDDNQSNGKKDKGKTTGDNQISEKEDWEVQVKELKEHERREARLNKAIEKASKQAQKESEAWRKQYEKKVDKVLEKMDDDGWAIYESMYRRDDD